MKLLPILALTGLLVSSAAVADTTLFTGTLTAGTHEMDLHYKIDPEGVNLIMTQAGKMSESFSGTGSIPPIGDHMVALYAFADTVGTMIQCVFVFRQDPAGNIVMASIETATGGYCAINGNPRLDWVTNVSLANPATLQIGN